MKTAYTLLQILVLLSLFLSGCSPGKKHVSYMSKEINVAIPAASDVAYTDEHGGFHGDGETFGKIAFDDENGEVFVSRIEDHAEWNKLPLTENLDLVMYGGERDGITYGYDLAEERDIPVVEDGYWFFDDRHSQSTDPKSDRDLLSRASFNFTLAIYDTDTNTLYYYEFDT